MMIRPVANYKESKQPNFTGVKEGRTFRRVSNKLISAFSEAKAGTIDYRMCKKGQSSLQDRLFDAVFNKANAIGDKFVTPEDRRLHEKLKGLFKSYEEAEEYADAMCGGGGHFVDRTVNFSI